MDIILKVHLPHSSRRKNNSKHHYIRSLKGGFCPWALRRGELSVSVGIWALPRFRINQIETLTYGLEVAKPDQSSAKADMISFISSLITSISL